MKKLIFQFFLFLSIPVFAESPQDEIDTFKELIQATKKNLHAEEKLLETLIAFRDLRQAFINDPTSGRLATKLVKVSMSLKTKIDEEHLEHLFSPEILTEIIFFSKVGQSQKISRES